MSQENAQNETNREPNLSPEQLMLLLEYSERADIRAAKERAEQSASAERADIRRCELMNKSIDTATSANKRSFKFKWRLARLVSLVLIIYMLTQDVSAPMEKAGDILSRLAERYLVIIILPLISEKNWKRIARLAPRLMPKKKAKPTPALPA
jgi:hypothetical protein